MVDVSSFRECDLDLIYLLVLLDGSKYFTSEWGGMQLFAEGGEAFEGGSGATRLAGSLVQCRLVEFDHDIFLADQDD